MDAKDLFKGVVLVIDDEVNTEGTKINQITSQIAADNIPLLKYTELPDLNVIQHLHGISFVLLDWQLFDDSEIPTMLGVSELQQSNDDEILQFLEQLLKVCYCPIFIFTSLGESDIIGKLETKGLYSRQKENLFFVKQKTSINSIEEFFSNLAEWLASNSAIYLLKQWDKAYQIAKEGLFIDFQKGSSKWVDVLCQTLQSDGETGSGITVELFDTLQKNITNRILVPRLELSSPQTDRGVDHNEIVRVIESTKFLSNDKLDPESPNTGDIFFDSDNSTYYVNIRPQCDILRQGDTVDLYCLKGKELKLVATEKENEYKNTDATEKIYIFMEGEFIEQKNNCIVSYICNSKIIEFKFRDLKIKKWNTVKNQRVGKLLPPFITNIRQKYAAYIEREGLPRLPDGLLNISENDRINEPGV